MKTEKEIKTIFYDNITPCNTYSSSEQFEIWKDGYKVGYINGEDDVLCNTRTTKEICELIPTIIPKECNKWLRSIGYYDKPASLSHHGTVNGDLLAHSVEVAKQLDWLTKRLGLKWERDESPILVGLLHDVCKCDDYVFNETQWEYNQNKIMNGHGDKSVMMLSGYIQLTEEEMYCIRFHMGSFTEKEEWKYYSRAVNKYPNVLYTHTADMIASQIKNI